MADAGKMMMTVGMLGVGGYVIYEYTRYNSAITTITTVAGAANATGVQTALPFMSYLMSGFSSPAVGTPAASALALIQAALAGTGPFAPASTTAPGTTSSGQTTQTSVTNQSSTSTQASAAIPLPTAADLQTSLNANTATADQWNYAFHQLTGYGIEQIYGTSFDAIYGPLDANGNRPTGIVTAQAFLNRPVGQNLTRVASLSGLGAIARFYTPVVNPMASMVYRAQHPSPYRFPLGMSGMGAFTQATGFEKALWAGRALRGNKVL